MNTDTPDRYTTPLYSVRRVHLNSGWHFLIFSKATCEIVGDPKGYERKRDAIRVADMLVRAGVITDRPRTL